MSEDRFREFLEKHPKLDCHSHYENSVRVWNPICHFCESRRAIFEAVDADWDAKWDEHRRTRHSGLTPPEPLDEMAKLCEGSKARIDENNNVYYPSQPSGGKVKTWCDHNVWINDEQYVLQPPYGGNRAVCKDEMFCPICAAPRPTEPSLEYELAGYLSTFQPMAELHPEECLPLAKAALAFLESKGLLRKGAGVV